MIRFLFRNMKIIIKKDDHIRLINVFIHKILKENLHKKVYIQNFLGIKGKAEFIVPMSFFLKFSLFFFPKMSQQHITMDFRNKFPTTSTFKKENSSPISIS